MKINKAQQNRIESQLCELIESTPIGELIPNENDYRTTFSLTSDSEQFYYVVYQDKDEKTSGYHLAIGMDGGYNLLFESQDSWAWEMIQKKLEPIRQVEEDRREKEKQEHEEIYHRKLESILNLRR